MDDKELIKRIMEEVKDERLREELLALVVEKNKKKEDTKQEEEKPIDYVARQEILLGATEGVAKVEWWIGYIISIVLILVGSLGPLGLLGYILAPDEKMDRDAQAGIILLSALFIIGLGMFFSLRSGKREYEKLKRKEENQGQS
ncbi:MAG: hypothetical protein GU346_03555 [Thermocrinis sp.]|nr:hypothetical protein [Thermocrinis sp.]